MIKPDAVERGLIGNILKDINDAGFNIRALKLTKLSIDEAKTFYSVHSERPFFDELTKYMSRSPIVAAVLEKENAVSEFRNLIGDTDPENAKEGFKTGALPSIWENKDEFNALMKKASDDMIKLAKAIETAEDLRAAQKELMWSNCSACHSKFRAPH